MKIWHATLVTYWLHVRKCLPEKAKLFKCSTDVPLCCRSVFWFWAIALQWIEQRNPYKIETKIMNLKIVYCSQTTNLHSYAPCNLHCTSRNILYVFWYTNLCGNMGLGDSRVKHLNVTVIEVIEVISQNNVLFEYWH